MGELNDNNSSNHINQDLTGLDAQQLAQKLSGFVNPADQAAPRSQAMHLKLNWSNTLEFENKQGGLKFEQTLALEKKYDTFCGQVSTGHACQPLQDYQGLKSKGMDDNGVSGNASKAGATILYSATKEDQAIQISSYLNWIKSKYGTSLTFQAARGVKAH